MHPEVEIIQQHTLDDTIYIKMILEGQIRQVIFTYISPKKRDKENFIKNLIHEFKEAEVIVGDFNCRSSRWDSKYKKKNKEINKTMGQFRLCNDRNHHTFLRIEKGSKRSGARCSTVDLLWTRKSLNQGFNSHFTHVGYLVGADHCTIGFSFQHQLTKGIGEKIQKGIIQYDQLKQHFYINPYPDNTLTLNTVKSVNNEAEKLNRDISDSVQEGTKSIWIRKDSLPLELRRMKTQLNQIRRKIRQLLSKQSKLTHTVELKHKQKEFKMKLHNY